MQQVLSKLETLHLELTPFFGSDLLFFDTPTCLMTQEYKQCEVSLYVFAIPADSWFQRADIVFLHNFTKI
jgi:hypothetical protein